MGNQIDKKSDKVFRTVVLVLLSFFAVLWLYPFFLLVVTTFKDADHMYDPLYIPDFTNFSNYVMVLTQSHFFQALLNTIIITAASLALVILTASLAGYMIGRSKEKIFKFTYLFIVCILIIPAQTNMMVIYKLGTWLGMINTMPYLIFINVSGGCSFAAMIYTAFMKGIPREIEESARIDGCGMYQTFFYIVFRLLAPATGAVIATTVFWWWNDFQGPLLYLNDGKTPTLMFEIFSFRQNIGSSGYFTTQWGAVFTLCLLASLPMILTFIFTQKHLLKALIEGAVKG